MPLPRPRWPRPFNRAERAILLGTVTAIVVAGAAAVATVRARTAVHQAAIASLSNYAAVGMEQFVNSYESLVRENFIPILPPPNERQPDGHRDPLPLSDLHSAMRRLAEEPCGCRIPPGPVSLFRLGLDDGDAAAIDSLGHPLPRLAPAVSAAVRQQAESLVRLGWSYGVLVAAVAEAPHYIYFSVRTDPGTRHRYAYGFVVPAAHLADRILRPAFQSVRLIPRHLLHLVSRNDEFLSLELDTPGGRPLFATTPAYPDGPSDALNLPPLRGGMVLRAHLNPRIKSALLPGGVPPRLPGRELGLIGLSLALLLLIAALGLRVGELARMRADLASSVTHELRTPLTQIRLAAETMLLGRSRSPAAEQRALASIVDESKRLQQLIDNVLHFSRAERRLTRVHLEPVPLRPLVERAAEDLALLLADRGVVVVVDIPHDVTVTGDADALRQIVLNLVDNAARYGPDRQAITIAATRQDGHVSLRVEDHGPGVPPADRERVWQAFVRLEQDRGSAATGTGLGLAVVRELVVAQGGSCWIESNAAQGATVVVRLAAA